MKGADTPYYARGMQLQKRTEKSLFKGMQVLESKQKPKKNCIALYANGYYSHARQ